MDPAFPTAQFEEACRNGDEAGLAELVAPLGFQEPKKSATNLLLLREKAPDYDQWGELVLTARTCSDPDQALNALERLASSLKESGLGPVLSDARLRTILLTVLGASRFLTNILCRHPELLNELFKPGAFDEPREEQSLLADLCLLIPDQTSFNDLLRHLRLFKQREILRIAARDLCGLSDLSTTTAELSNLAGACLQRAYEICDTLLRAEYGAPLTGRDGDEDRREAELTVLGMGKFGGRELNFSSDIDLIYCYSCQKGETAGIQDPSGRWSRRLPLHQYFVKLAESITKAMHQVTEEGFVFRVDLRLRPEGRGGEIAISRDATEFYYENWAQSWERSAMLKARPVAGSRSLGDTLLKNLEPFIYRRFLDYTMIEDLKVMKQKIDRNLTREREGELNLKLGRGGIREIEFFIQAMQLIHAGKHPPLREKNSLRALVLLQAEGLIDAETFVILTEAYTFLRNVEHRIQVVEERQTHNLPVDAGEFARLARRCGFSDEGGFRKVLEEYRQAVSAIYRELFYTSEEEAREEVTPEITALLDDAADPDLVRDLLRENGFTDPGRAYENLLILRHGAAYGHIGQQARRHLDRIAPMLLKEVTASPEPDMAFANLVSFLGALRARAVFFALLAENRPIIKLLISLFGTSQFLSRGFIQHPEILDYLVYGANVVELKSRQDLRQDLDSLLERADGFEGRLDVLRRFRNQEFTRIALNDIRGELRFRKGAEQLTLLAEVCLEKALALARDELLPRFGLPYCGTSPESKHEAEFAIVGMGPLGGRELNYHSDLDIIFIYEDDGQTEPATGSDADSFRPLGNQEYFARLAQKIISILSSITREGYVYKIDTRLRPSGNRGPLVTSFEAFREYQEKSTRLWERQALLKARVVAGPADFAERIQELTGHIAYDRPLPPDHVREIYRLRQEMERGNRTNDRLNIKTGRGGMLDVEFLVQHMQLLYGGVDSALRESNTLDMLKALRRGNRIENDEYVALANGYQFLRRMENKLRLIHDQSIDLLPGDASQLVRLARSLGYKGESPGQDLMDHFHRVTDGIRGVFDKYLEAKGPRPEALGPR
jgi:glutamate-ammonia-ligase adenylyltransferase